MITGDLFDLTLAQDAVVSIGVFDGVHRGHQHLLGQAVARARQLGCLAVAITFDPRPREVLRPDLPSEYVTTLAERVQLLGELGLDCVAVLHFSRAVAATLAEEFVKLLRARYRMSELWVGPDFALGRGREGTIPVLRELGQRHGFALRVVDPLVLAGEVVSSTLVHQRLAEGDVAAVSRLLGRPVAVAGEVVGGARRGRTLDLPTANVAVPPRLALPGNGVYAVCGRLLAEPPATGADGSERSPGPAGPAAPSPWPRLAPGAISPGLPLPGVASIGTRPTFDDGERALEVFLLDFAADIYGARLRVEFVQRLRPELRFPSLPAFLEQVQRDIAEARGLLRGCCGEPGTPHQFP